MLHANTKTYIHIRTILCLFSVILVKSNLHLYCTSVTSCRYENDEVWNITWPITNTSSKAKQKCPGSSESTGMHSTHYLL